MAGKQSLYEKHLQRIADSLGKDLIPLLLTEEGLKMAGKQSSYEKHLQRIADSLA